mmetsp:Transcript_13679/g.39892  ORF Transcript_13679/g.39892 Transcript_13679/m.39892 type:complete len:2653 (-) Transcript_13679:13-7971(-)
MHLFLDRRKKKHSPRQKDGDAESSRPSGSMFGGEAKASQASASAAKTKALPPTRKRSFTQRHEEAANATRDYISVRVVVGERMESVRCDVNNDLGWLLNETIRENEEYHSKLRWGITGLRRLQDDVDLDLQSLIGQELRDGDTVVARMLPPDFTYVHIVLGDAAKEFVCPRFKTVEQLTKECTRLFGGLFQVVGLVSPQNVDDEDGPVEFDPGASIGDVVPDGGTAIAVVAPFYYPLHGPWSDRFPESIMGAPDGFGDEEIEATWWDLMEKTLTRWVNTVLEQMGDAGLVKELFEEMKDGTPLLYLVVLLASDDDEFDHFDGFKPSGKAKIPPDRAVELVYQFLEQYVDLDDCPACDILDGVEESIASLLWSIYLFFAGRRIFGVSSQDEFLDTLFRWTAAHAAEASMQLESFGDVFSEGEPLLAILHSNAADTIPYESYEEPEENLRVAYTLAYEFFDVPQLLDPDDLPNFCEQACVMYLAEVARSMPKTDLDELEYFQIAGNAGPGAVVEGVLKDDSTAASAGPPGVGAAEPRDPSKRQVVERERPKRPSLTKSDASAAEAAQEIMAEDGGPVDPAKQEAARARRGSAKGPAVVVDDGAVKEAEAKAATAERRAAAAESRLAMAESRVEQLTFERARLMELNEEQQKLVKQEADVLSEKTEQLVALAEGRQSRVLELEAQLEELLEATETEGGVAKASLKTIFGQDIEALRKERDTAVRAKLDAQQQMLDALAKREERMKELTQANMDYQRQLADLHRQLSTAEERRAIEEAGAMEAKDLRSVAEKNLTEAKLQHAEVKRVMQEQQAAQAALIKTAKAEASKLQAALDVKNDELARALIKLKDMLRGQGLDTGEADAAIVPDEEVRRLRADVEEARRIQASLESDTEVLKTQSSAQQTELRVTTAEIDRLRFELSGIVEEHSKDVRELREQLAAAKAQVGELEAQALEAGRGRGGSGGGSGRGGVLAAAEVESLKSQVDILSRAKAHGEDRVTDLQSRLAAEEAEARQLIALLSQADKILTKLDKKAKGEGEGKSGAAQDDLDLLAEEDESSNAVELYSFQMNVSSRIAKSKHAKDLAEGSIHIERATTVSSPPTGESHKKLEPLSQDLLHRSSSMPVDIARITRHSSSPLSARRAVENIEFKTQLAELQGNIDGGMRDLASRMEKEAASLEEKLQDLGGFFADLHKQPKILQTPSEAGLSMASEVAYTDAASAGGEARSGWQLRSSNKGMTRTASVRNTLAVGNKLRRHSYLVKRDSGDHGDEEGDEEAERYQEVDSRERHPGSGLAVPALVREESTESATAPVPPPPPAPVGSPPIPSKPSVDKEPGSPVQAAMPQPRAARRKPVPKRQSSMGGGGKPRRSSLTVKRGAAKDSKKKASKAFQDTDKTILTKVGVPTDSEREATFWAPIQEILAEPIPETGSIKVGIRTRPLIKREVAMGAQTCYEIRHDEQLITLTDPAGVERPQTFAFDILMESTDPRSPSFVDQAQVFQLMGLEVLANAWRGLNSSIFAYGQTGAGKSYSMTGTAADPGLTRRFLDGLFYLIRTHGAGDKFNVTATYIEIYNEKVNDLLNPEPDGQNLRVREHPHLGPYCEGLKSFPTASFDETYALMEQGLDNRVVQATNMNKESSRSHSVFSVTIQKADSSTVDIGKGAETFARESKVSLIDLAGSERADTAGADALKGSGKYINQSLATLGKCVQALVRSQSSKDASGGAHIPFRESCLTWLLRDVLWGNAKTSMLAAISPADVNYEESVSTLRWAQSAKKIATKAVVNEDPTKKLIETLRKEVDSLRAQLAASGGGGVLAASPVVSPEGLRVASADVGWGVAPQVSPNHSPAGSRPPAGAKRRMMMRIIAGGGDLTADEMRITPYFKMLSRGEKADRQNKAIMHADGSDQAPAADPSTHHIRFLLPDNRRLRIGRGDDPHVDLELDGLGMATKHCILCHDVLPFSPKGTMPCVFVELWSVDAQTYVNGIKVAKRVVLKTGDRLVLGACSHVFVFVDPRDRQMPPLSPQNSAGLPIAGGGAGTSIYASHYASTDTLDATGIVAAASLTLSPRRQATNITYLQAVREVLLGGTEPAQDREERIARTVVSRLRRPVQQRLMEHALMTAFQAASEANNIARHMAAPALFEIQLAATVGAAEAAGFDLASMMSPERVLLSVRCFVVGTIGPAGLSAGTPTNVRATNGGAKPSTAQLQAMMRRRDQAVATSMSLVFQSDLPPFLVMLDQLRGAWQKVLDLVRRQSSQAGGGVGDGGGGRRSNGAGGGEAVLDAGQNQEDWEDDEEQDSPFYVRVFQGLDREHSGGIDREEVRFAMQKMGLSASDQDVDKAMQRFDADHSGSIDLIEFRAMLLDFMRAAFMRCIAAMVASERQKLNERFQGGETSLLQSYTSGQASVASIKQEARSRATPTRARAKTAPNSGVRTLTSDSVGTKTPSPPRPPRQATPGKTANGGGGDGGGDEAALSRTASKQSRAKMFLDPDSPEGKEETKPPGLDPTPESPQDPKDDAAENGGAGTEEAASKAPQDPVPKEDATGTGEELVSDVPTGAPSSEEGAAAADDGDQDLPPWKRGKKKPSAAPGSKKPGPGRGSGKKKTGGRGPGAKPRKPPSPNRKPAVRQPDPVLLPEEPVEEKKSGGGGVEDVGGEESM